MLELSEQLFKTNVGVNSMDKFLSGEINMSHLRLILGNGYKAIELNDTHLENQLIEIPIDFFCVKEKYISFTAVLPKGEQPITIKEIGLVLYSDSNKKTDLKNNDGNFELLAISRKQTPFIIKPSDETLFIYINIDRIILSIVNETLYYKKFYQDKIMTSVLKTTSSLESDIRFIGIYYDGFNYIYLLYQSSNYTDFFCAYFNVGKENFLCIRKVATLDENSKKYIISQAVAYYCDDNEIYWYLLGEQEVLKLIFTVKPSQASNISVCKNRSVNKEYKNASLCVLDDQPCILGGENPYAKNIAYGVNEKSYSASYMLCSRRNPIIIMLKDSIFIIGGNLDNKEDLFEFHEITFQNGVKQPKDRYYFSYKNISNQAVLKGSMFTNCDAFCILGNELLILKGSSFYESRFYFKYNFVTNTWKQESFMHYFQENFDKIHLNCFEQYLSFTNPQFKLVTIGELAYLFFTYSDHNNLIIEVAKFNG